MANLERMFPWAMANTSRNYVRPDPHLIDGPFTIKDLLVTPIPVIHSSVETFGFRFDFPTGHSLAYISDVKEIPRPSIALLQNLDVFTNSLLIFFQIIFVSGVLIFSYGFGSFFW